MRIERVVWVNLCVVGVLGFFAACDAPRVCNETTCATGCCDVRGECQPSTVDLCGTGGDLCARCDQGQACTNGRCVAGTGGGSGNTGAPRCDATAPICMDEATQQLHLFGTDDAGTPIVAAGEITEEGTTANEFTSHLDARAGGLTPTTSFTYARFDPSGLEKLQLSDLEAFSSLDWDIAVRRYVVRINSGVGGPSCVEAARVPPGPTFETFTQVPGDLSWRVEEYFTPDTCDYVPDTSGIGAPGTALSSFWTYQACVQMTHNLYVLHLRDGRYVKLEVLGYYDPDPQAECDATGNVPQPSGAGNVRIRWAFVAAP